MIGIGGEERNDLAEAYASLRTSILLSTSSCLLSYEGPDRGRKNDNRGQYRHRIRAAWLVVCW